MKEDEMNSLKFSKGFSKLERPTTCKNVLSSLFSKQFLGNVKNQLSKKSESSKFIQNADVRLSTEISKYKIQIDMLERRTKELARQNKNLRQQLQDCLSKASSNEGLILFKKEMFCELESRSKLKIISRTIQETVTGASDLQLSKEIKRLTEKIQQLQLTKSVKEERVNELLQKQARCQIQIRVLRAKQSHLESQVKNLKQSIRVQLSDFQQKALARTTNSDMNLALPDLMIGNKMFKLPSLGQEQEKMGEFHPYKKSQDGSLLASNCQAFEVPDHLHISKLCMKELEKPEEINEIDEILQGQLPFVQLSMDLDAYQKKDKPKKIQPIKNDFQNSLIGISLSQEFSHMPNGVQQSIVRIDTNNSQPAEESLVQSLIKIDV